MPDCAISRYSGDQCPSPTDADTADLEIEDALPSVSVRLHGCRSSFDHFVPAPEGEDFIVRIATCIRGMHTDKLPVDALSVTGDPSATIRLPSRLRPGDHGWRTDITEIGGI